MRADELNVVFRGGASVTERSKGGHVLILSRDLSANGLQDYGSGANGPRGAEQVTYLNRELSKVWQPQGLRAKVGISPMALNPVD